MPSTTAKGIPYPLSSDNNNVVSDLTALANWIDDVLGGKTTAQINALSGAAKYAGRVTYDTDKGALMFCDGTNWHQASVPVGGITWLCATSTPSGYLLSDGSNVSRTTYAKLFAKISTVFGIGDGGTTFGLPNLKGRTIFGFDAGQTQFDVVGETGGSKTVTLTITELPSHTHVGGAHQHTLDHDHASFSSSTAPDHQHTYVGGDAVSAPAGGAQTVAAVTTSSTGLAGAHSHTVDIPPFSGLSGSAGAVATTAQGGGAAFSILPPYITLQPYIKF